MRREQHQKSGIRWWIIVVVVIVVAVGGFFVGKAMNAGSGRVGDAATNSSSQKESRDSASSSKAKETSTMSSGSSLTSDSSSSAESSHEDRQTTTAVGGPYSVSTESMNAVGSFQYHGVNVPASLDLSFNDKSGAGTATFDWRGGDRTAVYDVMYEEIPTTSIRVFSANGNNVRTVKVNTRIHIEGLQSGESSEIDTAGDLYAFKNRDGGTSIATPNYAGNVTSDEDDVLQEIVHN